jgi:spoIIIJ-associated protein
MESDHPRVHRAIEGYLPLIESLLHEVIRLGRFDLKFSIQKAEAFGEDLEAPEYLVDFSGRDADLLLEKNGTLLDALEHVVVKAVRLDEERLGKIAFDCEDYRRLRVEELRMMAQVASDRVIETGDPFTLSPMNARERRIIHLALRGHPEVRTQSEGTGPERKVVIHPVK